MDVDGDRGGKVLRCAQSGCAEGVIYVVLGGSGLVTRGRSGRLPDVQMCDHPQFTLADPGSASRRDGGQALGPVLHTRTLHGRACSGRGKAARRRVQPFCLPRARTQAARAMPSEAGRGCKWVSSPTPRIWVLHVRNLGSRDAQSEGAGERSRAGAGASAGCGSNEGASVAKVGGMSTMLELARDPPSQRDGWTGKPGARSLHASHSGKGLGSSPYHPSLHLCISSRPSTKFQRISSTSRRAFLLPCHRATTNTPPPSCVHPGPCECGGDQLGFISPAGASRHWSGARAGPAGSGPDHRRSQRLGPTRREPPL